MPNSNLVTLRQVYKCLRQYLGQEQATWAVSQACHESNWFRSGLSTTASNFWGLRSTPSWSGKVYNPNTKEGSHGRLHTSHASFRAYSTTAEGVVDYLRLVRIAYGNTLMQSDENVFLNALQGRWTTDPNYKAAVADMITQVRDYLVGHP